ncbi:CDP-glucose 4,6-dehydratase (plasmid) [Cupriavidus taiwanensis]|uniref:CDP-glucose 4,6-dehydratase n=2 Tax=Cupriavidus taiwanensis TaxID=164546 RepID=A0A9Q7XTK6_9BURK|nr:CDP-glucose 4,6-dehydratase [Cupriavidus taiwanensis]SPD68911.1 CDP-glucose 4,6-dehydratase [Cupriavidus taiwanensis]
MTPGAATLPSYAGRSVFVTGHTGFKGSWLALVLSRLGARVSGYALPAATTPSLFEAAGIQSCLRNNDLADIRDAAALAAAMRRAEPELVIHLAAQPLVRASYRDPADTWSTNVMGTVHLLEAVRACPSVRAVIVVTTDKCYDNKEWAWGYRESDPLGGHDPYSASKAGAELVAASYRRSFLAERGVLLATARAGNVIGGGDWSEDRLIPDAARATAAGAALQIRHPGATRPWQHVLDALHGYLILGARLLDGDKDFGTAFNFGPEPRDNQPVASVLAQLQQHWPELRWECPPAQPGHALHEARNLYLDSALARTMLGWQTRWTMEEALAQTARWYRAVLREPGAARAVTEQQIEQYCA